MFLQCDVSRLKGQECESEGNCDTSRFLFCYLDASSSTGKSCQCNSTMFWNGNAGPTSYTGTCEYKRTINQYCKPYYDWWCDNTGPIGQGLICARYTNPYGSEYGKSKDI